VIEIDATLDGTLATVRSSGRIIGRSVTLAGLPPSDLVSAWTWPARRQPERSTPCARPSAVTLASHSGLALGGC
jgi:hypothetical protein